MKKSIFTAILGALGAAAFATQALAASALLTLSPIDIRVTEGEVFTQTIAVNPQGTKDYTVKLVLEYPKGFLEVQSFSLASGWMPLSQAGYDLIDNDSGILIKTAGYPSGVSGPLVFGTVSFLAKKAGQGYIRVLDDSFILDRTNQDVFGAPLDQTPFVVAKVVVPAPEEVVPEVSEEEEEEAVPAEEEATTTEEEAVPVEEEKVEKKEVTYTPPALFDVLIQPVMRQMETIGQIVVVGAVIIVITTLIFYISYKRRRDEGKK